MCVHAQDIHVLHDVLYTPSYEKICTCTCTLSYTCMYVHCTMVIIFHVLYLISSAMQISASSSREYYDNVHVYVPLYWVKPHQLYLLSGRVSMIIDHNEFGKCHLG